ncbi:MAG: sulfatase-like hydrolase/transferase, partial [Planctomycetota bacterium]
AADAPPNIVILLADDLGYGELGCQQPKGSAYDIPTPNIDSIAGEGVRMLQGYVTAPNCSPSRAGLLSGRMGTRFGYEFNPIGARNELPAIGLPAGEKTLARRLHDRGYATGLVGKWHLGGTAAYHPNRRGFDYFFGFTHEGHYFLPPPYDGALTMLRRRALPPVTDINGNDHSHRVRLGNVIYTDHMGHDEPAYDANNPIVSGSQPIMTTEYLTDVFTDQAIQFIDSHHQQPFFLMLAYNAVHSPLQAKLEDLERFESSISDPHRRIFAGMLHSLDKSVGRVLKSLRDHDLERRTLVIFLSDNGGPTRELTSRNTPLRGEKSDMYEGGIRVPWLMRLPGVVPVGIEYPQAVSTLDILPTVMTLAGGEIPANADGVDLIPYLNGERSDRPHRKMFWRQGKRAALRLDDWKLVRGGNRRQPGTWELYNLASDPGETDNLAGQQEQQLLRMQTAFDEMNREMVPAAF